MELATAIAHRCSRLINHPRSTAEGYFVASVDAGGEAADRCRELRRTRRGFGDGTAPRTVWGQLFTWRRLAREGRLGDEGAALVPVKIAVPAAERPTAAHGDHDDETMPPAKASTSTGAIMIELGHGRRIRVDRDFDTDALRRVIDLLDRRR